jgi:hypothetical protein
MARMKWILLGVLLLAVAIWLTSFLQTSGQPTAVNAPLSSPPTSGRSTATFSGSGEMDTAPSHLFGGDYDVRWLVWPNRDYLTCAFVVKLGEAYVGPYMDLARVALKNAPMMGLNRVYGIAPGEYVARATSNCGTWEVALTSR